MSSDINTKTWFDKEYVEEASDAFIDTLTKAYIYDMRYFGEEHVRQAFIEGAKWFRNKVENFKPDIESRIDIYAPPASGQSND